jgi:hypothetical protein
MAGLPNEMLMPRRHPVVWSAVGDWIAKGDRTVGIQGLVCELPMNFRGATISGLARRVNVR